MQLNDKLRSTVYYNLHQHCFSVQQAGRVKAHTRGITMDLVRFNVCLLYTSPSPRDQRGSGNTACG